ncbi:MAG: hypothetical protein ACM3KR_09005 [Deltaproteobacteria bacterium]
MNYASDDQLTAVAQSCRYFDSKIKSFTSTTSSTAENISCNSCTNWDGTKCNINVFDDVLTSLDQT